MKYNDKMTAIGPKLLAIIVVPSILAILILVMQLSHSAEQYDVEVYTNYIDEQEYADGTNSFKIDLTDVEGHYDLMIRTAMQVMTVKSGDEVIYECVVTEEQVIGEMPPSQWHLIELTDVQREEEIVIEYYSSYQLYEDNVPLIYYGTAEDLISYVTILTFPTCVTAWLTILIGMATILLCYVYQYKEIFYINYLGIFLIMFGMWSWGESKTRLFNYANLFIQSHITLFMIMIIPLPLVLYLRHKSMTSVVKRTWDVYAIICGCSTVIGVTLALTEVLDLIEYIVVSQIIIVAGIGMMVWANVIEGRERIGKYDKKKFALNKVAVIILLISTLMEIYSMYHNGTFGIGNYIRVGVVFFITFIFVVEIIEIRDKRAESLAMEEEMKKKLDAANLHIMNDKMTPHFIYNTLLVIQELCYSDPKEAAKSIGIFSKYTRINLEGIGEKKLIPFTKELEYIQLYMSIQKLCYEEEIEFQTDLQVTRFGIPPFSIQPIVENAVIHGIRKCMGHGVIKLKTWKEDGYILIRIEDNGAGFHTNEVTHQGFSSNEAVVYRIEKLLHGKLEVRSSIENGTIVTIQIPENQEIEVDYD